MEISVLLGFLGPKENVHNISYLGHVEDYKKCVSLITWKS